MVTKVDDLWRAQVENEACRLWYHGALAESNAFFDRFQISRSDLRIYQGDLTIDGTNVDCWLMVPMRDAERTLRNIAFVAADGRRLHLSKDHVAGTYFGIGKPRGVVVISEGLVRGVRIHQQLGHAVAVCFKASNVATVTDIMRAKYPRAKILLAAHDGALGSIEGVESTLIEAPLAKPLEDGRECAESDNSALAAEPQPANPPSSIKPLRLLTAPTNLAANGQNADLITDLENAKKLLAWLARRGLTEFTRKMAMQRGPSGCRTAAVVGQALKALVEHGWLSTADDRTYRVTGDDLSALANRE